MMKERRPAGGRGIGRREASQDVDILIIDITVY